MKKSEFKKLIKPLVQECIKEILLEGGLVSGIVAEVMRTTGTTKPIVESIEEVEPAVGRIKANAFSGKKSRKLQEQRKKLMSAIGESSYNGVNLFEGVTPMAVDSTVPGSPMSGQDSSDPGVDITNLFGTVGNHWKAHMNEVKENK
tara:strand:- start:709 stop:1146 length:438 start_codon:yes stop_codon:yes gene_type:complete